ncbi:LYR motif-containing protein 4 [Nothoprocta perdicaria]|uniref:LYR motif-containing protein 4 n=1 Tax=Nothoprocta perdicaria TaxID=30464 RepID=UPI000E1BBDA4|nr:LYR motif-containing protein 4 [Nothoprocta perdicaria]
MESSKAQMWRPGFNSRREFSRQMYAIRRIRDAFRENKNIKDTEKIEELVNKAKANLEIIHRQVTIGQLYSSQKLVIESPGNT